MIAALPSLPLVVWAQLAPAEAFLPDTAQAESIELVSDVLAQRTDRFAPEEVLHLAVTLVRSAGQHRLDPILLLAMIEVESSYRRRGRSPVGALGLMQLMPATAEDFADEAGLAWRGPRSLFEPDTNVEIGAAYLAYLMERFGGDRELALAAYCHGPTAIDRSLRELGALGPKVAGYGRKVIAVWRSLQRRRPPRAPRFPS